MKPIRNIAVAFICILMLQPSEKGHTQSTVLNNIPKEQENKKLKDTLDIKQKMILDNLKKAVQLASMPQKQPVRYITKIVYFTPEGTVVPDKNTKKGCDTVFYVIKKNNLIQRLFGKNKTDTLRVK